MEKEYKVCQSCSMPLKSDPNPEKRESKMYCSLCYRNGDFTEPKMTLEQMEKLVFEKAVENTKFPKFMIKSHIKNIKKLERWK